MSFPIIRASAGSSRRSPARSATSRGLVVRPWPRTAIGDGAMSGGTHLGLEERERLAALKAEGLSLRAIARALGRAASTVSRELRRNALPRGGYLPVHAEGCYRERRQRPAVLERDERLGRFVPRAPAGRLDAGADRRLAEAGRGARARSGVGRDDLRLRPPPRAEGREALEAAAARARQARPAAGPAAALHHRRAALDPRPARGRPGAQGRRALGR